MPVKIDMMTVPRSASQAATLAQEAEELGFDGWYTGETGFDSLVACTAAAMRTSEIRVGTSITVALARSPMTVAYAANDLQALSRGRFFLGLGSQIKQHIERRFSMPWSSPAARMSEYIDVLHRTWAAWEDGSPLDFHGEFYHHDLMPPMFRGERHGFGRPAIGLAGVGQRMTVLAGEKADAFLAHPFTSPEYVRSCSRKWLDDGIATAGRDAADVEFVASVFVVAGKTPEERAVVESETRKQLAFYASTPAYRDVLALHGWDGLQEKLRAMTRNGLWDDMASLITDEILNEFAIVVDDAAEIPAAIDSRLGGVVDRVTLYPLWKPTAEEVAAVRDGATRIQSATSRLRAS
ncbi:TIGR03617 family F420-dependent LLM class oxidoreductase [Streptomyces sp. NPDC090088]|uniref:TIGR03617 family F420-dependent LLM class oxidoreductase n=1 Tax=Streptomyces sp. NPDC090088 TaxID=3365944 RepID=UPI003815B102